MAPAPIESTARARPIDESKPKLSNIGEMIAAVVMMATVEEPWAVFKTAAMINGKSSPSSIPEKLSPIKSPIPVARNMAPKAPPAPVIKIMTPACFKPSPTQWLCVSFDFFMF